MGLVVAWQRRVTVSDDRRDPPPEVAAALHELDELMQLFAQHRDEVVQDAVVALLTAVDVLHRGALHRLGAFLDARSLMEDALADPHVALLFDLYESEEPGDERARAEAAVAAVRPEVEARGGHIEVVSTEGGVVNVRLLGNDADGPAAATLQRLVEDALREELPDLVRLQSPSAPERPREAAATDAFIPLSAVGRRPREPGSGGGAETNGWSRG